MIHDACVYRIRKVVGFGWLSHGFKKVHHWSHAAKVPSKLVGKGKMGFSSLESWMVIFLSCHPNGVIGGYWWVNMTFE